MILHFSVTQDEATDYAKEQASSFDAHSGQNILTSQFHPNPAFDFIATGSTDRTAAILNWKTGEKIVSIYGAHLAPILCLDWHPTSSGRLVMGSLDSSFSVVDITGLSPEATPDSVRYTVLTQQKLHKKHVVRVKWSPSGTRFATASYDHSVRIMEEKVNTETGEITYEQIKEFEFIEAVESLVWTKDGKWLIVSVRKDNYLHYFNPEENWAETKFNMNANQADDHVSFTAMDLHLSQDGKYLLVTTDKSRAIMFAVATPLQVRNFYDVLNGEWSTPRGVFNQSGTFIYVSSEDKGIYVYNTTTGAHVTTLTGHTSNIRDVASHPTLDVVASASFDKTVRIWM